MVTGRLLIAAEARGPILAAAALLGAALLLLPLALAHRARRRERALLAEAIEAPGAAPECPRCEAELPADPGAEGAARCPACGAHLLRAGALLIRATEDAGERRRRWIRALRARLRALERRRGRADLRPAPLRPALLNPALLSPAPWTLGHLLALAALFALARATSPPRSFAIPPLDPAALEPPAAPPASGPIGRASRRRAPLMAGTVAFARLAPGSPYFAFAALVEASGDRGLAVFADGTARRVQRGDLLAPEIAPGDELELLEDAEGGSEVGGAWTSWTVRQRVGAALLIRRGEERRWTSFARVRVRLDGAHRARAGLRSQTPLSAWVDARCEGELYCSGLALASSRPDRVRVVLDQGHSSLRPAAELNLQTLGPGSEVRFGGREAVVANRVGHALTLVYPDGSRAWTSIARVTFRSHPNAAPMRYIH